MGEHYSTKADVFSFAFTLVAIALKGREKLVNFLFRNINKRTKKSPNERSTPQTQLPSLGKVSHSLVSRHGLVEGCER